MPDETSHLSESASVSKLYVPNLRIEPWTDADGTLHRFVPDLGQLTHEPVHFRTTLQLCKRWGDWSVGQIAEGFAPRPYEIVNSEGNLITTTATGGAFGLWTGLATGTLATPFNTTNAQLAVGDSSATTSGAHTDLQAAASATVNIVSSTNATPIVVTSAAHSVAPTVGSVVVIVGHATNTNAVGTWEVGSTPAPSTTVYALLNSVGNGVGGATGTVARINKYRQLANAAGSAVITTNTITYVAAFGVNNACFNWLEWGLTTGGSPTNKQAAPPPSLFNRAIPSLGTKPVGTATWTLTVTLTIA